MEQLVCMDACLGTLKDELCQVSTRVGRIPLQQTVIDGFTIASSLSLLAFEDENDDGSDNDDADKDDDDGSPSDDAMST